jgi:hypothetical protein
VRRSTLDAVSRSRFRNGRRLHHSDACGGRALRGLLAPDLLDADHQRPRRRVELRQDLLDLSEHVGCRLDDQLPAERGDAASGADQRPQRHDQVFRGTIPHRERLEDRLLCRKGRE